MHSIFKNLQKDIVELFTDIWVIFHRNDSLMSKESIELLSNPDTRQEFIDFTSGKNNDGQTLQGEVKKERSKKFTLKNGEEITIVTYS